MNTLDQWEADAKQMKAQLEAPGIYAPNCDRILTLIDLIRKKDSLLWEIAECGLAHGCNCPQFGKVALALTEDLK